jgi:hypothetical protein
MKTVDEQEYRPFTSWEEDYTEGVWARSDSFPRRH